MFFLVGYFCCFNRGLGVRFCYFFLKWGGDCGKWIKYIQKVVIGNIWIPGKFLVFLPLGLAKQSRTILGHSTLEEPSFTLGLYQARPPSAASRHLSLAVGYLWGLKYVFFLTNLAANCTKFEPLFAHMLSAAHNLGSQTL